MTITISEVNTLYCGYCAEPILTGELSPCEPQPFHRECFFRQMVGGANHVMRRCQCFGGTCEPDPPGLTKRGAAAAALAAYLAQQEHR